MYSFWRNVAVILILFLFTFCEIFLTYYFAN